MISDYICSVRFADLSAKGIYVYRLFSRRLLYVRGLRRVVVSYGIVFPARGPKCAHELLG